MSYKFPLILVTDSIRVNPVSWNGTQPAMRLEFIGCYEGNAYCLKIGMPYIQLFHICPVSQNNVYILGNCVYFIFESAYFAYRSY